MSSQSGTTDITPLPTFTDGHADSQRRLFDANPEIKALFAPVPETMLGLMQFHNYAPPAVDEENGIYHASLTLIPQRLIDLTSSDETDKVEVTFRFHLESLHNRALSADRTTMVACSPRLHSMDVQLTTSGSNARPRIFALHSNPLDLWFHNSDPSGGWEDANGRSYNGATFTRFINLDSAAIIMDALTEDSEIRDSTHRVHGVVRQYRTARDVPTWTSLFKRLSQPDPQPVEAYPPRVAQPTLQDPDYLAIAPNDSHDTSEVGSNEMQGSHMDSSNPLFKDLVEHYGWDGKIPRAEMI